VFPLRGTSGRRRYADQRHRPPAFAALTGCFSGPVRTRSSLLVLRVVQKGTPLSCSALVAFFSRSFGLTSVRGASLSSRPSCETFFFNTARLFFFTEVRLFRCPPSCSNVCDRAHARFALSSLAPQSVSLSSVRNSAMQGFGPVPPRVRFPFSPGIHLFLDRGAGLLVRSKGAKRSRIAGNLFRLRGASPSFFRT